ncbi:hypothetical protein LK10_19665 [Sinomonas humi]|uniref:Uncharacterized protein n=2 Tax=Sinomonas humi TaxID=1338436 RepID=A0A0B2AFI1_9MICC|nr:hypothetical protein LK10_19665 [Sinomonas humi]
MSETFISRVGFWDRVVRDGQDLVVRRAKISKPNGLPEDGIAVCARNWPRIVLRREDAERLADMLDELLS